MYLTAATFVVGGVLLSCSCARIMWMSFTKTVINHGDGIIKSLRMSAGFEQKWQKVALNLNNALV